MSFVQPVLSFWIFFSSSFFFFFRKKTKQNFLKWTEGGAYRCDSERSRGPWVSCWLGAWGAGTGRRGWSAHFFTRCCCCSPGLYIECPLRCSLCRGAERRTCPRTSRCLVCVREMACTAGREIRWVKTGPQQKAFKKCFYVAISTSWTGCELTSQEHANASQ